MLRWVSTTGDKGPWSETASATIGAQADQGAKEMKSIATKSALLLPVIVLVVFISEAIVMAILHACGLRGIWDIVLDPLLLAVLVAPVLLLILPRLGAGRSSSPEERLPAMERTSRWRTVAALGIMGGIAALVLAGLAASHATFERETIKAFQEHQLAQAHHLAAGVEEIFEEVEQDLQYLARHPDLIAITPAAQEELDSFFETHSDVLNCIAVADAEGNVIRRSPPSSMVMNISDWPAFAAARDTGAAHLSEPQLCIIDQGVRVVRVTLPIDAQGKFGGVIYASIRLQKLWDKCLPRPESGRESSCWVIEDGGEILYDTDGRYTGRTWEEVEREWHEGGGVGSEEEEAAEEALRRRVQSGEEGTAVCWNNLAGGVDELMAFAPIRLRNERYGLAVVTPKTEIAGPIDAHARVTYALMAGMLLFLCVAGYVGLRGARARAQLLAEQRHAAERKQAGKALAQAHKAVAQEAHKLRSMIEGMDEGIVVADADDIITEVNKWFLEKVGLKRDGVVGKSFWEFHPGTAGTARVRAALDAFRSGERRQTYIVNRELLGMQLSLRVQPIFEEDRYQGVILNVTNVTDLAEARDAAEAARATLQETNALLEVQTARAGDMAAQAELANAAKSEFLANMSHEIRTPMTAILGFTEIMLDPDISDSEKLSAVHTVRRNGEHLLQIINDILDISKIEAGKLEVERIRCSPVRVVAEVKSLMQVRADAKNLPFKIEYIGAVPETIESDPTRLKQILVNLIGNAIKFTETGSVRLVTRFVEDPRAQGPQDPRDAEELAAAPRERSAPRPLGPFLEFDVLDTGLGMTQEQMGQLFQAFAQADTSTTRKFGGTGLGLMISKRLAEMLGGNITVESKPGVGSLFRVTVTTGSLEGVKMLDDPTTATIAQPEEAGAAKGGVARLDCRILLAEDGPDNQRLIAHVLKNAGAEVTIVENGKLAVDAAIAARDAGAPFDVILMDMQMPVMDGYEAAGLLRQKGYAGPIIALTAHAMASDRQKCLDTGCDDYASKPIDRRKLIAVVKRHVDSGASETAVSTTAAGSVGH